MRTIIDIKSLKDAIPKEGTWYKYYDDIFISVVYHQTPHIRRYEKTENDKKTDNKMCQWHTDWQYQRMESFYRPLLKVKTYEQVIYHEGEKHIIDSLIEAVAIEFQHTLNVSIIEIDSRYVAHSANGKIPYLILDLTNYNSDILRGTLPIALKNHLTKFKQSLYFKNNKLFCDFADCLVRFCKGCRSYRIIMTKEFFVSDLFKLEEIYNGEIKKEQLRLKEIKLENERNEKDNNNLEKYANEEFKYWRFCLKSDVLKINLEKYKFDFIDCKELTYNEEGKFIINQYSYFSRSNEFYLVVKEYRELLTKNKEGKNKFLKTEYSFHFDNSNLKEKCYMSTKDGIIQI